MSVLRNKIAETRVMMKDVGDIKRVLSIMNWTHHQWKNDGAKTPKGSDAISILNEVKDGGPFPCSAYAIVLRDIVYTPIQ